MGGGKRSEGARRKQPHCSRSQVHTQYICFQRAPLREIVRYVGFYPFHRALLRGKFKAHNLAQGETVGVYPQFAGGFHVYVGSDHIQVYAGRQFAFAPQLVFHAGAHIFGVAQAVHVKGITGETDSGAGFLPRLRHVLGGCQIGQMIVVGGKESGKIVHFFPILSGRGATVGFIVFDLDFKRPLSLLNAAPLRPELHTHHIGGAVGFALDVKALLRTASPGVCQIFCGPGGLDYGGVVVVDAKVLCFLPGLVDLTLGRRSRKYGQWLVDDK